jgi:hypothetical protein
MEIKFILKFLVGRNRRKMGFSANGVRKAGEFNFIFHMVDIVKLFQQNNTKL